MPKGKLELDPFYLKNLSLLVGFAALFDKDQSHVAV
jgi:hypothetical protein